MDSLVSQTDKHHRNLKPQLSLAHDVLNNCCDVADWLPTWLQCLLVGGAGKDMIRRWHEL